MRVTIIKGTEQGFTSKLAEIEKLYNDQARIADPERAFIAHTPGIAGGILFSIMAPPNEKVAQVLLAAFEPEQQRQGRARQLILKSNKYLSKKGARIEIVELDPFKPNIEPWRKLGFTHEDTLNFSPVCLTKPMDKLLKTKRSEGGISIQDLASILGNF